MSAVVQWDTKITENISGKCVKYIIFHTGICRDIRHTCTHIYAVLNIVLLGMFEFPRGYSVTTYEETCSSGMRM